MQQLSSFEELQKQIAEIRALRLGSITNFFPDIVKNGLWIEKRDLFTERVNNTLFIVKQSAKFWNVFYYSTSIEALGIDLGLFQAQHSGKTLIYDLVGRQIQCQPIVELFTAKGCKEATSFVRMNRINEAMDYTPDSTIHYATEVNLPIISKQLHQYFNEETEQIPYDEELLDYTNQNHVLVCEENGVMTGFLIFELNSTTLYLRYWFTHPDYRDRKVGSRLLRRFFEEGKNTKRQLFWVIQSNENAIKRYRHYGFKEEDMYDYVMQYNYDNYFKM